MEIVIKRKGKEFEVVQGTTVLETFSDFDEAVIALAEIRGEEAHKEESKKYFKPVPGKNFIL